MELGNQEVNEKEKKKRSSEAYLTLSLNKEGMKV